MKGHLIIPPCIQVGSNLSDKNLFCFNICSVIWPLHWFAHELWMCLDRTLLKLEKCWTNWNKLVTSWINSNLSWLVFAFYLCSIYWVEAETAGYHFVKFWPSHIWRLLSCHSSHTFPPGQWGLKSPGALCVFTLLRDANKTMQKLCPEGTKLGSSSSLHLCSVVVGLAFQLFNYSYWFALNFVQIHYSSCNWWRPGLCTILNF